MLEEETDISTLRWWRDPPSSYFTPYDLVLRVKWLTPKIVILEGASGAIPHRAGREICEWCARRGVEIVRAFRGPGRTIPGGHPGPDGCIEMDMVAMAKRIGIAFGTGSSA